MQIIFFLIFSLNVFAELQCDPIEAQDQCFKQLCTPGATRAIPEKLADIQKEAAAKPYKLTPQMEKDLKEMGALSSAVKARAAKSLTNGDISKMADSIFAEPEDGFNVLNALVGGEMKCINDKYPCELLSSNLVPYTDKMKNSFKKFWDATYYFRHEEELDLASRKKHLISMLRTVKIDKKEESVINGMDAAKLSNYSFSAPWMEEYKKKIPSVMKPVKADFQDLIKAKIESFVKSDQGLALRKKVVSQCQVTSYLKSKLTHPDIKKKFEKLRDDSLVNFKKKFLPKLSTETANTLSERIDKDSFGILESRIDSSPTGFNVGFHEKGYNQPATAFDVLKDMNLVNSNEHYGCKMIGLPPDDKYDRGEHKVFLSRFNIINGHGDTCAHEIGHWVSHQLSKETMSEHSREKVVSVRNCIQEFYPKDKTPEMWFVEGDKTRTEEDFADWIQAQVGTDKGLWCDMKQVVGIFNQAVYPETYTPDKKDEHSNFLFREINIRLNRGEKLPKICTDMMNAYSDFRPKKCEMK